VLKEGSASKQPRYLLEAMNSTLFEEDLLFEQIPCTSSIDQTKLFVFVDTIEAKKFTKSTLLHLANVAEQISPACQQLVLIVAR